MINQILALTKKYLEIWENTSSNIDSLPVYDRKCQKVNEKNYENIFLEFNNILSKKNNYILFRIKFQKLKRKIYKSNDYKHIPLKKIDINTQRFINYSKIYNKTLTNLEVFQASRNAIVMFFNQNLFDLKIDLTPSIKAYSLLYPYTDNFLDDPLISDYEKKAFYENLNNLLRFGEYTCHNVTEKNIKTLVSLIEKEFPRKYFSQVYDSLYAISFFQKEAMNLNLNNDHLLFHSMNKGSASLLAGGYLLEGDLDCFKKEFLFQYGFILQLLDDLQDISLDLTSGNVTFINSHIYDDFDIIIYKLFNLIYDLKKYNLNNIDFLVDSLIFILIDALNDLPFKVSALLLENVQLHSKLSPLFISNTKKILFS